MQLIRRKPSLAKILKVKTWLYAAYLLLASAALLLLLELGLRGLDALTGGKFPPLVESDYPSHPGDYVKIAIFGESAAKGYGVERSFEDVLRYELPKRYPERSFYTHNYARAGFTFHAHQAEIAKANIPRYDILLIYAGHNEHHVYLDSIGYFRKPEFKYARTIRTMPGDDMSLFRRLLDYHSRIYALMVRSRQQQLEAAMAEAGGSEVERPYPEFASEGALPPAERQKIDRNFREDLEEIAHLAEKYGKQVILMSAPSNESWKPMFSVLNKAIQEDQRKTWRQEYAQGLSLCRDDKFPEALVHFQNALAIDPGVAIANYYTGMTYRALGDAEKSKRLLRLAIDTDGLPIRALGSLFVVAKAVADESANVHYCDMSAVFEELVDRGYGWEELFVDIQHPSFTGHVAIALGFLGKIAELEPFKNPADALARVTFDTVDLRGLASFYREQLQISPVEEMLADRHRSDWFIHAATMSAYPEDFLKEAERHLTAFYAKCEEVFDIKLWEPAATAPARARAARFAKTHNILGLAWAKAGQMDQAIAQYRKALLLDPNCAEFHNNLGAALVQKGETGEANEHFQQALRVQPDDANAQGNLGTAGRPR